MTDHDDIEAALRDHLADEARVRVPTADWVDLTDRLRRRHRRSSRVVATVAAVAVIAAGTGGFAIGRAELRSDRAGQLAAGGDGEGGDSTDTSAPSEPGSVPATTPSTVTVTAEPGGVFTPEAKDGVNQPGFEIAPGGPLGHSFDRNTGGITMRVYASQVDSGTAGAADCVQAGVVQADVSTDAITGIAIAPLGVNIPERSIAATASIVGQPEQAPVMVVVVQVGAGADHARATFPGGRTDTMATDHGLAVLAVAVENRVDVLRGVINVEALHGDQTVAQSSVNADNGMFWVVGGGCPAPMQLPPAGEQPADAAAAKAAVTQAYTHVYDGSVNWADKRADVEDGARLDDAVNQLSTGGLADIVRSSKGIVKEIVFTAPDHAWVRYDITTSSSNFPGRIGQAALIDGRWVVARATWCDDIGLAGVSCP
jgi:hypothetical protein